MICTPAARCFTSPADIGRLSSGVLRGRLPRARLAPFDLAARCLITAAASVGQPVSKVTGTRRTPDKSKAATHAKFATSSDSVNPGKSGQQAAPSEEPVQESTCSASTGKAVRQSTRRPRDTASREMPATDLRNVHGVGPKNEQLLLKVGLSNVASLKDMYKNEHNASKIALKQYLQVQ